jgi:hypothetical protein
MTEIFALLFIYQIKHFVADYPLQGKYMLGKFKPDWGFFGPLLAHSLVHSIFTLFISYIFTKDLYFSIGLGVLDLVIHFVMDRIKAGPKYLGRFKDMMAPYFWWSLGIDQMIHHLTHYYLIYKIYTY